MSNPFAMNHPSPRAAAALLGLALALGTGASITADLTNPSGATVEALSTEIDSSNPEATNTAGGIAAFATTDQRSADLINPDFTVTASIGLFAPASAPQTRNAARHWELYD